MWWFVVMVIMLVSLIEVLWDITDDDGNLKKKDK